MFFYLSKILAILLNPILWVLGVGVYGLFRKNRFLIGFSFFLLYFLSHPYLAHWLMGKWEHPPQPLKEEVYDVAIVLGGSIPRQAPSGPLNLGESAERVIEVVRLYREGRIKKIILSGRSREIFDSNFNESRLLEKYMIHLGVDYGDVLIEDRSRNTYQNALYTSILLTQHFPGASTLLITSGFHMERAYYTFLKLGMDPDLYPVDMKSRFHLYSKQKNDTYTWKKFLIDLPPQISSIKIWVLLINEIIGFLAYTVVDYI